MELEQVYRYIDPLSILVMTPGKLVRVRCPFKVKMVKHFHPYKPDEILTVTKVMLSRDKSLVYVIGGSGFSDRLFRILL